MKYRHASSDAFSDLSSLFEVDIELVLLKPLSSLTPLRYSRLKTVSSDMPVATQELKELLRGHWDC
jgi:hypothetical protein